MRAELASEVPAVARGRFQGATQILRYNAGFFAGTAVVSAALVVMAQLSPVPPLFRAVTFVGVALALSWSVSSVVVSHWVYDRSGLYDLAWVRARFPRAPRSWVNVHAGLDESTPRLRELLPDGSIEPLDIFDKTEMTEPSIEVARRVTPPVIAPTAADYRRLPLATGSIEAVFLFFTAHELRGRPARERLFSELARVLAPGGRVVVLEHVRDLANAVAFGPGALHFLPRREWIDLARHARLEVEREELFTPFLRIFDLRKGQGCSR